MIAGAAEDAGATTAHLVATFVGQGAATAIDHRRQHGSEHDAGDGDQKDDRSRREQDALDRRAGFGGSSRANAIDSRAVDRSTHGHTFRGGVRGGNTAEWIMAGGRIDAQGQRARNTTDVCRIANDRQGPMTGLTRWEAVIPLG